MPFYFWLSSSIYFFTFIFVCWWIVLGCWDSFFSGRVMMLLVVGGVVVWLLVFYFFMESLILAQDERWRRNAGGV
ncbi:hypothetical protein JT358_16345, partial [Micrococcales bacterium 31B]|nr:hypothetical protein [Micrococcales bacterium 31B]